MRRVIALVILLTVGICGAASAGKPTRSKFDEVREKPWHLNLSGVRATYPEQEPNDSCPGQAIGCGDVIEPAAIDPVHDVDWYSYECTVPRTRITIGTDESLSCDPDAGNTYLLLYAPDCATIIAWDDDSGPGTYSLITDYVLPDIGTYYIKVRHRLSSSGTGCYMLSLTCSEPGPPLTNDQCDGAIELTRCTSGEEQGTLGDAADDYWDGTLACVGWEAYGRDAVYVVNAVAGDYLIFDYWNAADGMIYIVTDCDNMQGSCVAGADNTYAAETEHLEYLVTTDGPHYVILDAYDGIGFGAGSTFTLGYTIECAGETGACCMYDGSCSIMLPYECRNSGLGTFQGIGATCDPNPCPPAEPCCTWDGSCYLMTAEWCSLQGGTPQGPGVCDPNPCPQPPQGACCFSDGSCQVVPSHLCGGYSWLGQDTVCDPNPCPPPQACCLYGNCMMLPDYECTTFYGGTPLGIGTTCDPNLCPQPALGACCQFNGECLGTFEQDCGGTWQGADTVCGPEVLCPAAEACCWIDGSCSIYWPNYCSSSGGTPQGEGTVCDPNPCPQPPTGACCEVTGGCYLSTQFACGGAWQGADTVCAPETCPAAEACCFLNGLCAVYWPAHCGDLGGIPQGQGTTCDASPCPQPPTGACCVEGGECYETNQYDCWGTYLGNGTTCAPNPCPGPPRACCFPDASCQFLSPDVCFASNGISQDAGSSCSPNPCPFPCPYAAVTYDWSFTSMGRCGFSTDSCPDGGVDCWQFGLETIGGRSANMFGTNIGYDYFNNSAGFLQSPPFLVTAATRHVEVCHYRDIEPLYDGCNVQVGGQILTPMVGYSHRSNPPASRSPESSALTAGHGPSATAPHRPLPLPTPNLRSPALDTPGHRCEIECPAGALQEGELPCQDGYYDTYDGCVNAGTSLAIYAGAGGCGVMCGKTCGYVSGGENVVDFDFYRLVGTGGPITVTVTAEQPLMAILLNGDCNNWTEITPWEYTDPCNPASFTYPNATTGHTYYLYVYPYAYGTPTPEFDYVLEVCGIAENTPAPCLDTDQMWSGYHGWTTDCFDLTQFMGQTISVGFFFASNGSYTRPGWRLWHVRVGGDQLGACCSGVGECTFVSEPECLGTGGTWMGQGAICDPNPCPRAVVLSPGGGPYPTIQAAVDDLPAGSEVILAAGTFTGPGNWDIDPHGKQIVIRGDPAGGSIIDGGGNPSDPHRAFNFWYNEGPGVRIEDLTLVGCISPPPVRAAWRGGAISCGGSSPTINRVTIVGALAVHSGGGVYCWHASPTITNCTIVGCSAVYGGGIYLGEVSTPTISKTIIASCTQGGAIYCDPAAPPPSHPSLDCCDLYGNVGGDWTDCIADQLGVNGNVSVDPLFCDESGSILTLRSDSPLADLPGCGLIGSLPVGCLSPSASVISPVAPADCISLPHPCVTVPVNIARNDVTNMRRYSVTVQLSPELALCAGTSSITEGTYLSSAPGITGTSFQIVDNGGGSYTIDGAILGSPCGATAPAGTLFDITVKNSGADGTGTVSVVAVLLRDCAEGPIGGMPGLPISVTIDNTPPAAITDLVASQVKSSNDADGTTKVMLAFTVPPTATAVEVYRAGYGHYPEYDDGGGATPETPTSYPPATPPWFLAPVTASGQPDEVGDRGFYYYLVYAKDDHENPSLVSNKTTGTLNYHLGDVSDPLPGGDNDVDGLDVSALGSYYGKTLTADDPYNYLDVGPTTDYSVDARPVTDNRVDFEDMQLFAINYGEAGKAGAPLVRLGESGGGPIRLEAAPRFAQVREGQVVDVPILLRGGVERVQGVRIVIGYDPTRFAYATSAPASAIALANHFFRDIQSEGAVDLGLALLGTGASMSGEGVVATVRLRALKAGRVAIALQDGNVRDTANHEMLDRTSLGEVHPQPGTSAGDRALTYHLGDARPNPFNHSTTIEFQIPATVQVRIVIYDVAGRQVRTLTDQVWPAGSHALEWDGVGADGHRSKNGIYFYAMWAGTYQSQQRLALLK